MDRLKDQLIKHEGLELRPYQCSAGKWTIGVGRNLEDKGISQKEALDMLDNDIADCKYKLITGLTYFQHLDPVRQAVLINMCFNLGFKGLTNFKKMLTAVQLGDYEKAAIEMIDSRWAEQVGGRARELASQMQTGEWE